MKIVHKFVLRELVRLFLISLGGLTFLFLLFDFFDRIDVLLKEEASFFSGALYFLFKIPNIISLMIPVSMLLATMLTLGIMSKNSEITALRSSGLKIIWICRPIIVFGLILSIFTLIINETLVPFANRRTEEIYNFDIRKKAEKGVISQSDFWWRKGEEFFSVNTFDSRSNTIFNLSRFTIGPEFKVRDRTTAEKVTWVNPMLGWTMHTVTDYRFPQGKEPDIAVSRARALPIQEKPEDFFELRTKPETMSYRALKKYIKQESANGISVAGYLADLHAKISFPFVTLIVTLVVIPFALKPARSGSLAASFIAGLVIGFSYYAVHSFSITLGRAEIWSPMLAAWMANILMGFVAFILHLGAEAP